MSETTHKIRSKIIKRLNSLSQEKLLSLEDFINQIDTSNVSTNEILSFAGLLKDMDDEVLVNLTDRLFENRIVGKDRIL